MHCHGYKGELPWSMHAVWCCRGAGFDVLWRLGLAGPLDRQPALDQPDGWRRWLAGRLAEPWFRPDPFSYGSQVCSLSYSVAEE